MDLKTNFDRMRLWIKDLETLFGPGAHTDSEKIFVMFQSIINSVADPLMVVDTKYRVRFMNQAASDLTGIITAPKEGLFCYDVNYGVDKKKRICPDKRNSCPMKMVTEKKSTVRLTHRLVIDGKCHWREIVGSPLFDLEGKLLGIVLILRDITAQKKLEKELASANERLEYLLKESPAVIYTRVPDGKCPLTYLSENIKDQMGYEAREFLENPDLWGSLVHPEDKPRLTDQFPELFKRDRYVREYRFLDKGGRYRWLRDELRLIRDENGDPQEIVGYWVDISDRKKLEEELRERVREIETIFEHAPIGLIYLDRDMKVLRINPFVEQKLGIEDKNVRLKHCYDVWGMYADDSARVGPQKICDGCVAILSFKDGGVRVQEQIVRPDLIVKKTSVPIKDEEGQIQGVIEMIEDITEQKRKEDELCQSEARFRSLVDDVLDSSSVGIFILDSDFRVVWINKALEHFFGIKRNEVIGKDNRELIEKRIKHIFEDPDEFSQKLFAAYDNNTYTANFECHVISDRGREDRWLEHWSQPINSGLYKGGRIEHYYDITERKRAEAATSKIYSELNQIFETAADGMCVIDLEGIITRVNSRFGQLFKIDPEDAKGRKCREILAGPLCDTENCPLTRIFERGEDKIEVDTEKELGDGTKIPCLVTATPLKDPEGRLLGVVRICLKERGWKISSTVPSVLRQ